MKKIDHKGTIESIENTHIRVKIQQASACSACQVKAMCASADCKEKVVDVWDRNAARYRVGEEVTVCASLSMGRNAVSLAFLVPLTLMTAWLVAALKVWQLDELTAIGGVLLLLTAYYVLLACFRHKLSRTFAFWIEKTTTIQ